MSPKPSVSPRTAPFQNEYRASEDGMRSSPGNCWDFRFQSKEDKNYIDNKHNNGIIIKNTFERAYENTNPTFERFAHKRS